MQGYTIFLTLCTLQRCLQHQAIPSSHAEDRLTEQTSGCGTILVSFQKLRRIAMLYSREESWPWR